jgi:AmmeMemoRadiSam system protein A
MPHVLLSEPGHTRSERTPPVDIPQETQRVLLGLARAALATATGRADLATFEQALQRAAGADEPAAVFVTLTEHEELRGCIGTLDARRPLCRAVAASAISAALDDPRFAPVSADELPAIHVEISVLGPFHQLVDQDAFRPGIDGLVVESGGHVALLLPEVATASSWRALEMFTAVCRKAGLPSDAWRDPRTRLSVFRTDRFGGPAIESGT